jgi:hypothetical protein
MTGHGSGRPKERRKAKEERQSEVEGEFCEHQLLCFFRNLNLLNNAAPKMALFLPMPLEHPVTREEHRILEHSATFRGQRIQREGLDFMRAARILQGWAVCMTMVCLGWRCVKEPQKGWQCV